MSTEIKITLAPDDAGRQCGSCQLCCRLVPVASLGKPAGVRCRYQRFGHGCAIYACRPADCRVWSCRWLMDEDVAKFGLRRPDHTHYVIDLMPDLVTARGEDGSSAAHPVMQVWIDPRFPAAHRDPALRKYVAYVAETTGNATLLRWNNDRAALLVAPSLSTDGTWIEFATQAPERSGTVGLSAALAHMAGSQA